MSNELHPFLFIYFKSLLLGIIQGFTEFLPISSTAHLKVFPHLFGWSDPGVSFSASLQLGSAFAIIYYFREEIGVIINSFFSISTHRSVFDEDNKPHKLDMGIIYSDVIEVRDSSAKFLSRTFSLKWQKTDVLDILEKK